MDKKQVKIFNLLLLLFILPILISCSSVTYEKVYPILRDGKYDSEFPYSGSSAELNEISKTVQRINSTGFYRTYVFAPTSKVTIDDILKSSVEKMAFESGLSDQSSSGTATTIYHFGGKVALLTCAHVVNYPDTIISFMSDAEGNLTNYVETMLIKENQVIYAAGFPEGSDLDILAIDEKLDVAIIGRDYPTKRNYFFPVFNYPIGKAKDLEWGTFVYVFGFPMNFQMITKAIVSSPDYDGEGSFLLDAVVNKGSSGSIILAIKDGVPNFELVGIVRKAPIELNDIIVPPKKQSNEPYNLFLPYKGQLYVSRNSEIKYGITKVVSIESILKFIDNNKAELLNREFYLEIFLNK